VKKVEDGKLHLHNPWGYKHPDPLDVKAFWEYYRQDNYGGTRDGHYVTTK
jgi:hypothetical protein